MQPLGQAAPAKQVLVKSLADLVDGVNASYDRPSKLAFFLLLFASVDVIASLRRPKNQPDTSGEFFKEWVEAYMLPNSGIGCTAEELWGARCGMLHTLTVGSKLSRKGKVRQIYYISGPDGSNVVQVMQAEFDKAGDKVVVVDHHHLLLAFIEAVRRFTFDLQRDPALMDQALFHAETLVFSETLWTASHPTT